jgi:hypothetical protein
MKTENLIFNHFGNGVTVRDRNRYEYGNFMTVAHISYRRKIKYYTNDLSASAKLEIDDFATFGNMAVSATRPDAYALCSLPLIA